MSDVAPGAGQREARVVKAIARRAVAARRDMAEFFAFVMREETTRERIRCLAHQRLVLAFVEAHPYCVVRMPVGFSKTYLSAAISLHLLGTDPTSRGLMVSASSEQAQKPLGMVASYIEGSEAPELRAVFPALRKTQRQKEKWTKSAITVDRPASIRDASLAAAGVQSKILGSRLNWFVIDDILDEETTRTEEARVALRRWFARSCISRRDPKGTRIVVLNTPWHEKDLTYSLEFGHDGAAPWPTLTLDAYGGVYLRNTDWSTDLLRPSIAGDPEDERGPRLRLTEHDAEQYGAPLCVIFPNGGVRRLQDDEVVPVGTVVQHLDIDDEIPLWPEKFSHEALAKLFEDLSPVDINQQYLMRVRDETSAHCKIAWVEGCKALANATGHTEFVQQYRGPNLTVTAVDLGIGLDKKNDQTVFFTTELVPTLEVLLPGEGVRQYNNVRRILDIERGRWPGGEIIDRIIDKTSRFNSIAVVESNAAQRWIRQWANERNRSVPVTEFVTGMNKHSRAHGVISLFVEIENCAWLMPADGAGRVPPAMNTAIEAALYYKPPPAHTPDVLMAWWIGREKMRELGRMMGLKGNYPGASFASRVRAR